MLLEAKIVLPHVFVPNSGTFSEEVERGVFVSASECVLTDVHSDEDDRTLSGIDQRSGKVVLSFVYADHTTIKDVILNLYTIRAVV